MFSLSVMKSTFCLAHIEFIAIPATSFVDTVKVTFENVCMSSIRNVKFIKMLLFTMFITAVCIYCQSSYNGLKTKVYMMMTFGKRDQKTAF